MQNCIFKKYERKRRWNPSEWRNVQRAVTWRNVTLWEENGRGLRGENTKTHTTYSTYEAGLNKKISSTKKTRVTEKYQKWVALDTGEARAGWGKVGRRKSSTNCCCWGSDKRKVKERRGTREGRGSTTANTSEWMKGYFFEDCWQHCSCLLLPSEESVSWDDVGKEKKLPVQKKWLKKLSAQRWQLNYLNVTNLLKSKRKKGSVKTKKLFTLITFPLCG